MHHQQNWWSRSKNEWVNRTCSSVLLIQYKLEIEKGLLWRINETTFNLKVFGNQFVGVQSEGSVVATATSPGKSETFRLVWRRQGQDADYGAKRTLLAGKIKWNICLSPLIFAKEATSVILLQTCKIFTSHYSVSILKWKPSENHISDVLKNLKKKI